MVRESLQIKSQQLIEWAKLSCEELLLAYPSIHSLGILLTHILQLDRGQFNNLYVSTEDVTFVVTDYEAKHTVTLSIKIDSNGLNVTEAYLSVYSTSSDKKLEQQGEITNNKDLKYVLSLVYFLWKSSASHKHNVPLLMTQVVAKQQALARSII